MSDSQYYVTRAKDILDTIQYITLATVTPEGLPWNSPLFCFRDNNYNFYWISDKNNQHSKNLRAKNLAYGIFYDSTVKEGDGEGVYISLDVIELSDPQEIECVRKIKKGQDYVVNPDEFLGDAVRRIYKAIPNAIWMNDAEVKNGQFIRDYKVTVALEDLKRLS